MAAEDEVSGWDSQTNPSDHPSATRGDEDETGPAGSDEGTAEQEDRRKSTPGLIFTNEHGEQIEDSTEDGRDHWSKSPDGSGSEYETAEEWGDGGQGGGWASADDELSFKEQPLPSSLGDGPNVVPAEVLPSAQDQKNPTLAKAVQAEPAMGAGASTPGGEIVLVNSGVGEGEGAFDSDPFAETQSAFETDPFAETQGAFDSDPFAETKGAFDSDTFAEIQGTCDSEPVVEIKGVPDSDPYAETQGASNPDPIAETEGALISDPFSETQIVFDSDPFAEIQGAFHSDPFAETQGALESDSVAETEGALNSDPFAETLVAFDSDPFAETKVAFEPDPFADTKGAFDSDPFAETQCGDKPFGWESDPFAESSGVGGALPTENEGSGWDRDPFANSFPASSSGNDGPDPNISSGQEFSGRGGFNSSVLQVNSALISTVGGVNDNNIPRIHKEPEHSDMSEDEAANRRLGKLYQELDTEKDEVLALSTLQCASC